MSKLSNLLIFIFISNICFSQIPNSGFENWTNMGAYENPDSWGTMNNKTAISGIYTATKGSPGNPGAAFLKLTSRTVGSDVINGIAVSGVLDSISQLPKSGFAFSLRPQSFVGNWQHMIYGSSQGSLSAVLTRWNTGLDKRDTVAIAKKTLSGMAMSWAAFTINFTYQSGEFPDSCIIVLKSSGATPTQNDYLWVDNLSFTGSVAGISETDEITSFINAFPNPANSEIEFSYEKAAMGDRLIITDMFGKTVYEQTISEETLKINTSNFANGMYLCNIINKFNVKSTVGKFTVQH
jgi:hypothetical protein